MDKTKLAHNFSTDTAANDPDLRKLGAGTGEIRVLDDLELALAGGGEADVTWP